MTNDKLAELYYTYQQLVKDTAYKVLGDYEITQDVCHDVFLRLSDEWIEADVSPKERARYLRVVAYNRAIDYYKVRQKNPIMPYEQMFREDGFISTENMDDEYNRKDFLKQLLLDLKEYKEDWYMVLLRSEIYHEPVELVSRELGISISLARVRLHRAKKWIQERYSEEYRSIK